LFVGCFLLVYVCVCYSDGYLLIYNRVLQPVNSLPDVWSVPLILQCCKRWPVLNLKRKHKHAFYSSYNLDTQI